jgi:4-amino-4-deoxychorismate lyase
VIDRLLVHSAELLGDGVFETLHLRPDGPWLLGAHLDRLFRSAAMLGIELPPRDEIAARAAIGCAVPEGALRIIATRSGLHVAADVIPAATIRERHAGVRVVTAAVGPRPPWSLSEAKTLSYAENLAARRWARAAGADDVLLVSHDGFALEGTTASLVWLDGSTLCTVPPGEAGILAGTTSAYVMTRAVDLGLTGSERMVTPAGLARADGIWLTSALRGPAEVIALDGVERARSPMTPRLRALLGYP